MKAAAAFSCLPSKSPSLQLDLIPLRLHPGEELREDRLFRHQELPPLHSTPNLIQSPDPPPNTWTVSILPSLPNGPSQYLPNHTRVPSPASTSWSLPIGSWLDEMAYFRVSHTAIKKTPASPYHHGCLVGTHLHLFPN